MQNGYISADNSETSTNMLGRHHWWTEPERLVRALCCEFRPALFINIKVEDKGICGNQSRKDTQLKNVSFYSNNSHRLRCTLRWGKEKPEITILSILILTFFPLHNCSRWPSSKSQEINKIPRIFHNLMLVSVIFIKKKKKKKKKRRSMADSFA